MDYFINQDGNDTNTGDFLSPWRTTHAVHDGFRAGRFGPGDRILFARGQEWHITKSGQRIRLRGSSGTATAPIVIGAYGEGARPVLHGAPDLYVFGRRKADDRADHITIQDLEVCDVGGQAALRLHNCQGIRLQHILVHDITTEGGPWCCAINARYDCDLIAEDVVIRNVAGEGFYVGMAYGHEGPEASLADQSQLLLYGGRIVNTRNNAIDIKGGVGSLIDGVYIKRGGRIVENQSVCLGGQSHVVRNCYFLGGQTGVAEGTYLAESWSGYHHLVERCLFNGLTQEAVRLGGGDNTVRNCTFANCDVGVRVIQAREPHLVERSIFYNVSERFVFGSSGHDTKTVRRDNVGATTADFENEETFDLNSNSPLVGLGWRPNPGGGIMSVIENLRSMAARLRAEADALEAEALALEAIDAQAQATVVEAQETLAAAQVVEEAL